MDETRGSAEILIAGYENVETVCPTCGYWLVLNRRSDLDTLEPVGGMEVPCTECRRPFWLSGDSVNSNYETLILDCYELLRRKRYMACIVNVCQSYELYFAMYLRVDLLYRPLWLDGRPRSVALQEMNRLSRRLAKKTKSYAFHRMRSVVLRRLAEQNPPQDLQEAECLIDMLGRTQDGGPLRTAEIRRRVEDDVLANLLVRLKETNVNTLRNQVVHKRGYRPSREEAEGAVQEARSVLFPLGNRLGVRDEALWYRRRADR